jgi:hypothetical protein
MYSLVSFVYLYIELSLCFVIKNSYYWMATCGAKKFLEEGVKLSFYVRHLLRTGSHIFYKFIENFLKKRRK